MSKPEEHGSIGVMEFLIIFGFTAFFAWYFLIIIGYPRFFPVAEDDFIQRIVQLMSFLGMMAGSVFALYKPKDYEKTAYDPRKTVGWAVVSCIVPVLVMVESAGIGVPVPAACAVMVASGFGAGYYMTGWENLASRDRMSDGLVALGLIMAVALALVLLIELFMMPVAQGVMGILFAVTGAVLFYGVSKRRNELPAGAKQKKKAAAKEETAEEDDAESFRGIFSSKLDALLLFTNIPLGFGLAIIYLHEPVYFFIALGVALVALVVFVLVVRAAKLKLTFANLLRAGIGAVAVALILLGIAPPLSLACSIILIAAWLVLRVAHSAIVLNLTKVQKVPPVYLTVRAKQPGYAGFIIGFVVSIAVVALTDGRPAIAITGLVIAAVLVVASMALLPFSENYSKQLDVLPVVVDLRASTAEDIEHAKCAVIAKRFNLSPREEEILFFIVKGRNAKFIAEKLIISESTAKTHIHNIYKKSGIHSQQKFIDLMDEVV